MDESSVARAFESGGAGGSSEDVWAYGAQICRDFRLSGEDLFNKWEVAFGMQVECSGVGPTVRDLEKIQHDLDRRKKSAGPVATTKKLAEVGVLRAGPSISTDDFFSELGLKVEIKSQKPNSYESPQAAEPMHVDASTPVEATPTTPRFPLTPKSLNLSEVKASRADGIPMDDDADVSYSRRDDALRIELTVGNIPSNFLETQQKRPDDKILDLRVQGDEETADHRRYMNETVGARSEAIRARIQALGGQIATRLQKEDNIPEPTSEAFFVPSPDPVLAIGRIRCELEESAGKINMSSVLLEGEEGGLVKLELSRLVDQIFLIPGHIVAVHGVNPSGRCIKVYGIYDDASAVETRSLVSPQPTLVKIIAASGPFTTSRNLLFRPLDDLLEHVTRQKPHVLVLIGPFLDANHPLLRDGSHIKKLTFEQVFRDRVISRIESALENIPTHTVLVPAIGDIHHDFVCPQSPFAEQNSAKLHFAPNPAIISLDGDRVRIGATSLPVLEDISADTICRGQGDRFGSMTSLMLRQRSFYPIFPPSRNVPLDTTRWDQLDMPASTPIDLLLAPSRLKPFVKEAGKLGNTLCINPGQLSRGENGGTFAEVALVNGAGGPALGRSRSEVVRI